MLTRSRRPPGGLPGTGAPSAANVEGWITALDAAGCALVDFEGNCAGPLPARSLLRCSAAQIAAAGTPARVLLGFEGFDTSRPIIFGLLSDCLVTPAPALVPALVARVDGHRLELSAEQEIVLRCGRASITLRADGGIVIKGGEVQSRASGRNRITGSTVAIN